MQIKTRLYVKVLFINTFPNTGFLIEPFYYPTGVSNSYGKGWDASVVDVLSVLTESISPQAYWRKLKQRLKVEGNESVTNCHGLKMRAEDGKMRITDVADTEQLFRLIQSVPSPKAEPFKQWLAQVGRERMPLISSDRKFHFYTEQDLDFVYNERRKTVDN